MSIDNALLFVLQLLLRYPSQGGGGKSDRRGVCVIMDEKTIKIVNRLKSIKGHVSGVEKIIGDDAYCIDIVKQIEAIQAAQKVNAIIRW